MLEKALFVFITFILVSLIVEQFYAKRIKMGPGVELRNGIFMISDGFCKDSQPQSQPQSQPN